MSFILFLKKIKNSLIKFISDIRIYKGGIVLFGDSSYHIKGPMCREILNILKPGDLLLKRYDHYLGALVIPGYWCHIAIYVGGNKVIQMNPEGINSEDILSFLRSDNIKVLRYEGKNANLVTNAIKFAEHYLSKKIPYDFSFDFSNCEKMSCTELVNDCYGYPNYYNKKFKNYIIPDDFLFSIFNVVWTRPTITSNKK